MTNISAITNTTQQHGGAQFWVYVSPDHHTPERVTDWEVRFEHLGSNWTGYITSKRPELQLQTPGLSGEFKVSVTTYPSPDEPIQIRLLPLPQASASVACGEDGTAMVGIVATSDHRGASYWTASDVECAAVNQYITASN